jgi:hypothetical protein
MSAEISHAEDLTLDSGESQSCSGSASPLPLTPFGRWIGQAKPGECFEYHRGFLTVDRSPASHLADHERRVLTKLAGAALSAAQADQVHLVQRRNGPADFSYLAIKAKLDARREVTALPVVTAPSTTPPDLRLGHTG